MTDEIPDAAVNATPQPHRDPSPTGQAGRQPASLSSAERAAAFTDGRSPVDRKAAFRAGTVPVPRRFVLWLVVAFVVLGVGGIIAEHFVGNAGVESEVTTPIPTLAGTGVSAPPTPTPPAEPPVGSSLSAFIGLSRASGVQAPDFTLVDQHGQRWTLADARGRVVVLTFFNAECNDICPVLAQEISQADTLLGPRSADVDFVVVNTDPLETSTQPVPPALTLTGLSALSNLIYLTGPVSALDPVWKEYGITVAVENTTRVVSHGDIMEFIDPSGRLRLRATPFGNEDQFGVYNLDPSDVHRFAQGITTSASGLIGSTS